MSEQHSNNDARRSPRQPPAAPLRGVLCDCHVIRRKRTEQRERARAMRRLVRDREKLAALSVGGSEERPIPVASAAVVEVRIRHLGCPQCDGEYRIKEHRAPASGIRSVDVTCQLCGVSRTLWFRLISAEAN
jgi:hypothetical protein